MPLCLLSVDISHKFDHIARNQPAIGAGIIYFVFDDIHVLSSGSSSQLTSSGQVASTNTSIIAAMKWQYDVATFSGEQ